MPANKFTHLGGALMGTVSVLAFGICVANPAVAEVVEDSGSANIESSSASGESSEGGRRLDVVVVTSEKRSEDVQDVPLAISAFSADALERRGIDTPQDLQLAVPGLSVGEAANEGGSARVTLRGIGTENLQPGGDPGVPIHINGHYAQSTAYVLRDMIDVERVEVLRGPQGTLYGRNAIGGSINIITKRPTDEFEGYVSIDVGNYAKRQIEGVVSGPLTDNMRARLVVADAERGGFVEELGEGEDRNSVDYTSIRGALEYDATDNLQLYLNAYYFDDTGNTYARRFDSNPNNIANTDPWAVRTNTPNENSDTSKGVSLDVKWSLDGAEFRSLTAYDDTFKESILDSDGYIEQRGEFGVAYGHETFTQEFQLVSDSNSPLQWVAGMYYYKEDSSNVSDIFFDGLDTNGSGAYEATDPRANVILTSLVQSKSYAAYGQVDYEVSDKWDFIVGLRYTKDEKERIGLRDVSFEDGTSGSIFGGLFVAPTVGQVTGEVSGNWGEVTGKLGLNYHFDISKLLYASYSRGYKAGGFNASSTESYDPEYVDALEAGLKSQWFDDRVQLNLAAFYYQYKDKQDNQRIPLGNQGLTQTAIRNAAKAEVVGLELESQVQISDRFLLVGAVSYLDAEYSEFVSIDQFFPNDDPDRSGNKLALAPEWKFNIGAEYGWDFGPNGSLLLRGDYAWVDDQFGGSFNRDGRSGMLPGQGDFIPAYDIANARLRWESQRDTWSAELYVNNLTDELAFSNSFVGGAGVFVSQLAPRTYGFKLVRKL